MHDQRRCWQRRRSCSGLGPVIGTGSRRCPSMRRRRTPVRRNLVLDTPPPLPIPALAPAHSSAHARDKLGLVPRIGSCSPRADRGATVARKPLLSFAHPATPILRARCRACRGALAAGGSCRAPVAPAVHLRRGPAGSRLAESTYRRRPVGPGQVTRLYHTFHTLPVTSASPQLIMLCKHDPMSLLHGPSAPPAKEEFRQSGCCYSQPVVYPLQHVSSSRTPQPSS